MRIYRAVLDRFEKNGVQGWRWLLDLPDDMAHTGWAPSVSLAVEGMKNAIAMLVPEGSEKIEIEITIKDEAK